MKRIIISILLFSSLVSKGQIYQKISTWEEYLNKFRVTGMFRPPLGPSTAPDSGALYYNKLDSAYYKWTGNAWRPIGGSSSLFGLDDVTATGTRAFDANNNTFKIDSFYQYKGYSKIQSSGYDKGVQSILNLNSLGAVELWSRHSNGISPRSYGFTSNGALTQMFSAGHVSGHSGFVQTDTVQVILESDPNRLYVNHDSVYLVNFNNQPLDFRIRPLPQTVDTTLWKPAVIGPNGQMKVLPGWPGSGGGGTYYVGRNLQFSDDTLKTKDTLISVTVPASDSSTYVATTEWVKKQAYGTGSGSGGSTSAAGSTGDIQFKNTNGGLSAAPSNKLNYDSTNNILQVNNPTSPNDRVEINGNIDVSGSYKIGDDALLSEVGTQTKINESAAQQELDLFTNGTSRMTITNSLITLRPTVSVNSIFQIGGVDVAKDLGSEFQLGAGAFWRKTRIVSNGSTVAYIDTNRIGVNNTAPLAMLHITPAGTGQYQAGFKLSSGSLLTVPEAGAVENDGTDLWYTDDAGSRHQLTGGGGGSYTFSNALTESGGAVKLGGTLIQDMHISGGASGHSILLDSSSSISLFSGLEYVSSGVGSVIQMSDSVMNIGSSSATDFTSMVFSPTKIKFTAADGAGNAGDIWTNTGSGYCHWAAQPKIYTALLTQSGTGNPTATVLGDNRIGTIVWTRNSTGNYTGTLTGAFTSNKTWLICQKGDGSGNFVNGLLSSSTANTVTLITTDNVGTLTDAFTNMSIEIRVYP